MIINNIISRNKLITTILIFLLILSYNIPIIGGNSNIHDYKEKKHSYYSLLLTEKHIPILRFINNISNNALIKIIFAHIIQNIIEKKVINTEDINRIVDGLNIKSIKISFFRFIYGTADYANFFCFPGYLFANIFPFEWGDYDKPHIPYVGPSIIMMGNGWLNIGIKQYHGYFITIGFLGVISLNHYEHFSDYIFIGFNYLNIIIY
jgi:hypothetical protein